MTRWTIYWITRLDGLRCVASVFLFVAGIAFLTLAISWVLFAMPGLDPCECGGGWRGYRLLFHPLMLIAITCALLISLFLPTTEEAAAIYLLPKIANNQRVQELPDNALKFLNAKLEEWIDENKPKKK